MIEGQPQNGSPNTLMNRRCPDKLVRFLSRQREVKKDIQAVKTLQDFCGTFGYSVRYLLSKSIKYLRQFDTAVSFQTHRNPPWWK